MAKTNVTDLKIEYPSSSDLHLELNVGACRLKAASGAGDAWLTGTYQHPSGALPPKIEISGGHAKLSQEFKLAGLEGLFTSAPRFDLKLGTAMPYALTLQGGAYEGEYDLGGLPLTKLVIKKGAGEFEFNFSAPNPQVMSLLEIDAGAASIEMENLANANFSEMKFSGGVGSYELDFGGTLQQDAHVKISTGVSSVEISVPASTAAKIITAGVLSGLDVGDGFTKREGAFLTEAATGGKTPLLTIHADVSVGSLKIKMR